MIIKNQTIDFHEAALRYCEKGGALIYSQKCDGSAGQIANQMTLQNLVNKRCKKKYVHIKIRPAPEDFGKLVEQDLVKIAVMYLENMDLHENAYAIYIHEKGTPQEHIHIVASRIKPDHHAAKDNYSHYRNNDFCSLIEDDYDLRKIERVPDKLENGVEIVSEDLRLLNLKKLVDEAIKVSKSIEQLKEILSAEEVTLLTGRGAVFIDKDKVRFKGSKLGRNYSLSGIQRQLQTKGLSLTSSASSVQQTSSPNAPVQAQEKSVQLSSSSSASLSENNGNMNSDIDEIINSGKKSKQSL